MTHFKYLNYTGCETIQCRTTGWRNGKRSLENDIQCFVHKVYRNMSKRLTIKWYLDPEVLQVRMFRLIVSIILHDGLEYTHTGCD